MKSSNTFLKSMIEYRKHILLEQMKLFYANFIHTLFYMSGIF